MEQHRFYPDGPEGHVEGTGIQQEVSPERQVYARTALEQAEAYAVKSQTHLWLMLITYKVPEAFLDAQDGLLPQGDPTAILDPDAMMGQPTLVCYVCEQAYDRRIRRNKCPGEANPGRALV